VELHVELRQSVGLVHASIPHVTLHTSLADVANLEALDGLILGNTTSAVGAADDGGVPTTALVPSSISSLLGPAYTFLISKAARTSRKLGVICSHSRPNPSDSKNLSLMPNPGSLPPAITILNHHVLP